MAHYCVSDIHGNIQAFHNILKQIKFTEDDKLYVLGDVCDRREFGIDILLELMGMKNAYLIKGNHEEFLSEYVFRYYIEDRSIESFLRYQWFPNGGISTYTSFLKLLGDDEKLALKLIEYIRNAPLYAELTLEGKTFLLRHNLGSKEYNYATSHQIIDKNQSLEEFSVWNRRFLFSVHYENKTVIFGHTPTIFLYETLLTGNHGTLDYLSLLEKAKEYQNLPKLKIFEFDNQYCIDCGASFPKESYIDKFNEETGKCEKINQPEGRLACLRLEDMKEFYSD